MRKQAGFSLIELMIVLTIISIIAAFAVPTYFDQIRKGKRAGGKSKIMEIQLKLETWRSDNRTYTANLVDLSIDTASNPDYQFTVTVPVGNEATSYTVTATAQGEQAKDGGNVDANGNGACAVLTANQSNAREPSACWF